MKARIVALATPLLLVVLVPHSAWATSFSESQLGFPLFTQDVGTVSSSIASPGNLAQSSVAPLIESMAAKVMSDGTVSQLRTSSSHDDDLSCGGSCSAVFPSLAFSVGINFDAVLMGDIARGAGEFELDAGYTIGGNEYQFSATADSTPIDASSSFNGDPVSVIFTTDASGNLHLSTHFVRTIICPCSAVDAPFIHDSQGISIEMEGKGTIDASHTFTVTLTPLDPTIVLTSVDGRTIGTAPSAEPVPEPASLLLLGVGLIPLSRRLRRRTR